VLLPLKLLETKLQLPEGRLQHGHTMALDPAQATFGRPELGAHSPKSLVNRRVVGGGPERLRIRSGCRGEPRIPGSQCSRLGKRRDAPCPVGVPDAHAIAPSHLDARESLHRIGGKQNVCRTAEQAGSEAPPLGLLARSVPASGRVVTQQRKTFQVAPQ